MKLIGDVSSNMGYYTEVFNVPGVQKVENFTQTSESGDTAQPLLSRIGGLEATNKSLLKLITSPAAVLLSSDEGILFYTGILSKKMFDSLCKLMLPCLKLSSSLSPCDQFLITLMKLRLGFPLRDLADCFSISISHTSNIFHQWLDVLSRELQQLIVWPDREIILETLPACFKEKYYMHH